MLAKILSDLMWFIKRNRLSLFNIIPREVLNQSLSRWLLLLLVGSLYAALEVPA
jgi:hypothetical protein